MMRVEVAVVGAGPAGSVAASCLAAAGVSVALLEQATFPRDKACGDGVMTEGLSVLERLGLGTWAKQFQPMQMLRLTSPDAQVLDIDLHLNGACSGRIIPRRLLDAKLACTAVDAGAHLKEGVRVKKVVRTENGLLDVIGDGLTVTAQLAILADGSNAPVTRRLGVVDGTPELFALRQYLVGDSGPSGRLEIHFQSSIVPGYNWLFPVGEGRLNVGTGTYLNRLMKRKISLQAELTRFMTDPITGERLLHVEPVGPVQGHPLRTSLRGTRVHGDRILVAGDAAGLVSPFTGEGIAAALRSGEMAAAQALEALKGGEFSESSLAPYSRALRGRYQVDQAVARMFRFVLSNSSLLNRVFRSMRRNNDLAELFGEVFLDKKSPQVALRPLTLLRFLFG